MLVAQIQYEKSKSSGNDSSIFADVHHNFAVVLKCGLVQFGINKKINHQENIFWWFRYVDDSHQCVPQKGSNCNYVC